MMVKQKIKGNIGRAAGAAKGKVKEFAQRPGVITACECAVRFALTLVLSRARIFGAYAPFGVSMLAAAGVGVRGASALAGALLGYLVMGGLTWGLKYTAMCVLIFSASFVFRETGVYKKSFFVPLTASVMAAVCGFVYMSDAGFSTTAIVFFVTETVLTGGCALFYRTALSPWDQADPDGEMKHTVCLLLLGATALISLSGIYLAGFVSLGRAIAVASVMVCARKGGLGAGAASGVALGLAMDAAIGRSPFFSMIYGFSGLLSGAFSKQKRLLFTLAYMLSNLVATLWAWDGALRTGSLYETFIASVVFMVLPAYLLAQKSVRRQAEATRGAESIRLYSAGRMENISAAFRELYDSLRQSAKAEHNDGDVSKVFARAAALVCRKCRRAAECWSRDYSDTMGIMNDATEKMLKNGELKPDDLPERFTEACLKPEAYTAAVNDSLRASLYRRQCKSRVGESRNAAMAQYREVSDILSAAARELKSDQSSAERLEIRLSRYLRGKGSGALASVWRGAGGRLRAEISGPVAELSTEPDYLDKLSGAVGARLCQQEDGSSPAQLALMEAEPLAASLGVASMRRAGQSVCGDSESFFKTDSGELCVILSDGMGSGDGAAELSSEAVSILRRFISAGVEPASALRILSSVFTLRGDENGCATADILCADLFSGRAGLYKCGAAPTYIRSGGSLRRICGSAAAVGLPGFAPDRVPVELPAGSLAVMVSDGVVEGGSDKWLRDKISAFEGGDVKGFAGELLSAAMDAHGGEDDMTVICALISRRE